MKHHVTLVTVLVICGMLAGFGCAQKAASAREAIESSKTLKTAQEQAAMLVKQAELFYSSKEFQQAIDIAQYILSNLDKDSAQAKSLLEKATSDLKAAATKAAGDVAGKLFGK